MTTIDDRENELTRALYGLVELARANFPRSTDINVSIALANTASGSVTIPWTLLAKLLSTHPRQESGHG